MIEYAFLGVGVAGAVAFVYYVAPAGRGLHRYVMPRAALRADIARLEREADQLTCNVARLLIGRHQALEERGDALEDLTQASLRIADLEKQLEAFDALCAENTQLRAELDNARAMRQLLPGPSPADDASALPDSVQEFADATATAWRASA